MTADSIEKLRDCLGEFKNRSEGFSLDMEEFRLVFGLTPKEAEPVFGIWDREGITTVDALEVFCGLAVCCNCALVAKLRCRMVLKRSFVRLV